MKVHLNSLRVALLSLGGLSSIFIAWYLSTKRKRKIELLKSSKTEGAYIENKLYLTEHSPLTSKYIMQQTMLRIKDPKESLKWYSNVLGMRLLVDLHFPEYKFSLYFMGYCDVLDIPLVKFYRH